jgi:hypothetical protein
VLEGVADELCRARESQRRHDLVLVRFHRAGDTLRAAATSFIVRPSATSRTTSRWRGVSFSRPDAPGSASIPRTSCASSGLRYVLPRRTERIAATRWVA